MRQLKSILPLAILLLLPLAGCMVQAPTEPTPDGGAHHNADLAGDSDALPPTGRTFGEACTDNSQCESMLCTQDSYDRLTHPICTSKCDPSAASNPQCPDGCNKKGYCRLPNM